MKKSITYFGCALLLCAANGSAFAQDAQTKAILSIIGYDISSAAFVDYCEENGQVKLRLQEKYDAWRTKSMIAQIEAQIGAQKTAQYRQSIASLYNSTKQKMAAIGDASKSCNGVVSVFDSEDFNMRAQFPEIYQSLNLGANINTQMPSQNNNIAERPKTTKEPAGNVYNLKNFNRDYVYQDLSPTGTFYTPPQLSELVRSWWQTKNLNDARRAMDAHGPIIIQGKVIKLRDSYFIDASDENYHSKLRVSTGIDISMFEGQIITVIGKFDELPSSLAFLRKTRLIQDASRLKPSNLGTKNGLYRNVVDNKQIMASAGNGLKTSQIHGVLYHGYGATGASGYEYREEIRLLLKDGSAYFSTDIAPENLDVEKSKKLEPNLWGKWRQNGNSYQIAQNNEFGELGQWHSANGRILPKWPNNHRLSGAYSYKAFYGSAALGGTYSSTSFVFHPDGRFERIGYSQSGSGSMAQIGSGFSASASSYSDAKGASSVAGGGSNGDFGGSNYASSSRKSNDGSGSRGTYKLDGLSLEMKYDNGRVENALCAPWDAKYDKIYMFGSTYSRK